MAFVRAFILRHPLAYAGMLALQTLAVLCAVLVSWSLGQITRLVSQGLEASQAADVRAWPLAGFAALLALEMVSMRAASGLHIYTVPRQRRAVTQALFAYLQRHSHRYITSKFAGALAHRISEVSLGTTQTLAILIRPSAATHWPATSPLRAASAPARWWMR
ncbi:hypothetical protein NJI34_25995 [Pseudomonas sp. S 311-6]|uniref:hypothetical protein n=1 Tax=Pseudomonas TaxID=286 RepID=UPI002098025D|nr:MULTISPECIES: hypothetical protein [Pseudomonas]MCO7565579.1 hypothetical protein [Pseudomonas mosselii]MCO7617687.1 hypothetical protein [Pseudomonas guariconensis]MCO7640229.1 hypothetical protein [Pseudomonas sp. S 311-6]